MHTEPELLGLLALGEHVGTEDDRVHIQACSVCAAELSELQRVVTLGCSISAGTTMVTPSQDVWVRIREELGFNTTLEQPGHQSRSISPGTLELPTVGPLISDPAVKPASKHAGRSLVAHIKAALARSSHGSSKELTAHAHLAPVEASWSHASGRAELATDEHGRRVLRVALHADLPTSGVRQAWLVHRNDPNLRQTLGVLDGPHGLWTVEHSIDLEQYAILDISQQATGETDHSDHTIVRGPLTLVSRSAAR